MIAFKHILVPTDFSDASKIALNAALDIAKLFRSDVVLLHVYEPMVYFSDMPIGMTDIVTLEQSVRESSETYLDTLIENIHSRSDCQGLHVEKAVVQGKPFAEIIRVAAERDSDLIVMSTHGRGGWEHMLLGSVTEKVVRKAPCAVLTVRVKDSFKKK
jgi:nucleotide-binding universal stress UspA family protein